MSSLHDQFKMLEAESERERAKCERDGRPSTGAIHHSVRNAWAAAAELVKEHEQYESYPNRETWAVGACYFDNERGLYDWSRERVREAEGQALRKVREESDYLSEEDVPRLWRSYAADALQEHVEELRDRVSEGTASDMERVAVLDIGSMHRVEWYWLASSIVDELEEG